MINRAKVDAPTQEHCAEHLARIRAVIKRHRIQDAIFILNLDQTSTSLQEIVRRSLQKGIGKKNTSIIQRAIRAKENLNCVIVILVVSAAEVCCKLLNVYPGKLAHYRKVWGVVQVVHSFLPPCYIYRLQVPRVDSSIMLAWAQNSVKERQELWMGGQRYFWYWIGIVVMLNSSFWIFLSRTTLFFLLCSRKCTMFYRFSMYLFSSHSSLAYNVKYMSYPIRRT